MNGRNNAKSSTKLIMFANLKQTLKIANAQSNLAGRNRSHANGQFCK